MKPYYEDEYVTLYHGDCLEVDAWLTADVLVTDPPYGMNLQSGMRGKAQGNMRIIGDDTTAARDSMLLKWGSARPALVFSRWNLLVPGAKQCLVWDKGEHVGMGDLNIPWKPNWEPVFVLGKWPARTVSRGSSVIHCLAIAGALQGERGKPQTGRDHPTPKPVPLMEALVERTPPGVIADPFAGSGATLIAARNMGRKSIGVEIDEAHCEVIAKRLQQQSFDFAAL